MHTGIRYATLADIPTVRALALAIWPQVYSNMISAAQLEYMLEWMYSHQSLQEQMMTDHRFLLLTDSHGEPAGYAAFRPISETNWKLEKLYVLPSIHGQGFGKTLLRQVMSEVKALGGTSLELQVNRNNPAVGFYRKLGFDVWRDADFDIGNGFYMIDHIMGRSL